MQVQHTSSNLLEVELLRSRNRRAFCFATFPRARARSCCSLILSAREVVTAAKFVIDTVWGERHDRAAPSCLGLLPKEFHLTCFPQGNRERMARSHNEKEI